MNKENEQTREHNQNDYDHIYFCNNEVERDETVPIQPAQCSSQTAPSCSRTLSTSTKKKMRINKTGRLQESLKTNSRFIDMNELKFSNDKIYQDKKISLIETKLKNKKIFQDRVASALENMAESLEKLASEMS